MAVIRFWPNKQALVMKVVPSDNALQSGLKRRICDEINRKRDQLLDLFVED